MGEKRPAVYVRAASGLIREIDPKGALMFNLMSMGLPFYFVYMYWATALYPGVNTLLSVVIGAATSLIITALYALMCIAMPRTGGDYVWVSRILHPALGFMCNFYITFVLWTWIACGPWWTFANNICPSVAALGAVTGNQKLIDLATTLGTPMHSFLLGVILVIIYALMVMFMRTKTIFKIYWALCILTIIGLVTFFIGILCVGHAKFIDNFARYYGDPETIIAQAKELGAELKFKMFPTVLGSLFVVQSLLGYNFQAYIAGEIREVKKSNLLAGFGSIIIDSLVIAAIIAVTYYAMGSKLFMAIMYLVAHGQYIVPFEPTLNGLLSYGVPNVAFIILVLIGVQAAALCSNICYFFLVIRNMFAWAFDRVIPSKISEVDSRFHQPYIAIIVTTILVIFFLAIWNFTTVFMYFVYANLGWFIATAIVSIAGIVFPYRRKDLFERAPEIVKAKVGGVPVISIVGVASLIVSLITAYAVVWPAAAGMPVNPLFVAVVISVFVISIVIYYASYFYHKSKGLPLDLVFAEIPPA